MSYLLSVTSCFALLIANLRDLLASNPAALPFICLLELYLLIKTIFQLLSVNMSSQLLNDCSVFISTVIIIVNYAKLCSL